LPLTDFFKCGRIRARGGIAIQFVLNCFKKQKSLGIRSVAGRVRRRSRKRSIKGEAQFPGHDAQ
jgi:hypothetical protein